MNRSHFLTSSGALVLTSACSRAEPTHARQRVYFGTFTQGPGKGIFLAELDLRSGMLSEPRLAGEAMRPGFLAVHPSGKYVFSVGEAPGYAGKDADAVLAYQVDAESGTLAFVNKQPGGGVEPCHLTLDPAGNYVLTAQYGGGSCSVFPVGSDGSLKPRSSFHQHTGFSGVNAKRQEAPHAHSILLDPTGRLAVVADLGKDQVLVYRFDAGVLTPADPPAIDLPPGSGPRHVVFHPTQPFAYVNMELTASVSALTYEVETARMKVGKTYSTLPADWDGLKAVSEIRITPNGRFLYVGNRGHDSIAVFAVDPNTGELENRGHTPTGGKFPRNFNIDPTGRYLIVANQQSSNVVVFAIHPDTGALTATGSEISVPKPVCVAFA